MATDLDEDTKTSGGTRMTACKWQGIKEADIAGKQMDSMSNETPRLFQVKRLFPRMAFSARVALHSSVLFVVALFPCAESSIGLLHLTESETPVDRDESSDEAANSVQVRTRVRRNRQRPGSSLLVTVHGGQSLPTAGIARTPQSGHRLPNNLMAPLRR